MGVLKLHIIYRKYYLHGVCKKKLNKKPQTQPISANMCGVHSPEQYHLYGGLVLCTLAVNFAYDSLNQLKILGIFPRILYYPDYILGISSVFVNMTCSQISPKRKHSYQKAYYHD